MANWRVETPGTSVRNRRELPVVGFRACASDSSCRRAGGSTWSVIDPGAAVAARCSRSARLAEAGPWESVWVYDHFHTVPMPTAEATHEAWTLMAALAATTTAGAAGPDVHLHGLPATRCTWRRSPPPSTSISGGRVEMGIGAGWYEHEWRPTATASRRAGDRIAMLAEGVQIMRRAWADGAATSPGEHYQVDGAICRPQPLQAGRHPALDRRRG